MLRDDSKEATSVCRHGFQKQGAVEEIVTPFTAGLGDEQTAVAGGAQKRALVDGAAGLMVGANRIVRTDRQTFESLVESLREGLGAGDEAAQRPLRTGRGGVDQDPVPRRRIRGRWEGVDALLQRARGIAAIERDLGDERVREAVQQDVRTAWKALLGGFGILAIVRRKAVMEDIDAPANRFAGQPVIDGGGSKWMKIPSPNCSIPGSQSVCWAMGAPDTASWISSRSPSATVGAGSNRVNP